MNARRRHAPRRFAAGAFALAFAAICAAADAPPPLSPEPFFRFADFGSLQLSPSGNHIAGLVPSRGRRSLAVLDLATNKIASLSTFDGGDIVRFDWVNDKRIVFTISDLQSGLGEDRGGGLFAIDRDGSNFRELAPTIRKLISETRFVYRYTFLFATLSDGSDDVLVLSNESSARYPDVYRLNTSTARKTLKTLDRPGDVIGWVADNDGAVRAAVTEEKGTTTRVWWRPKEIANWTELGSHGTRGARVLPVAFDGDGSLIVASNVDRDTFALYRYDLEQRKLGELLVAHPRADIAGGIRFDRTKNRIVGVQYEAERPGTAWFDDVGRGCRRRSTRRSPVTSTTSRGAAVRARSSIRSPIATPGPTSSSTSSAASWNSWPRCARASSRRRCRRASRYVTPRAMDSRFPPT